MSMVLDPGTTFSEPLLWGNVSSENNGSRANTLGERTLGRWLFSIPYIRR